MAKPKLTAEQKALNEKKEAAAREKSNLESNLKDLRRKRINPPSLIRKVGDRVRMGNIEESVITEVLDDGKIYLLAQKYIHNNYGTPIPKERVMHCAWHDVQDYKTNEEYSSQEQFAQPDIFFRKQFNTEIRSVLSHYYNNTNMDAEYQRENVWEEADKIALIDSIFNNVDIGKFTFIKLPFDPSPKAFQYEILDGKQRLQALVDYTESRFDYKGKKFRELHPMDKHKIESYMVVMSEAENLTFEQKCQYFVKLNTTGKPQSKEHLDKVMKMMRK
jgi:hypothetical protein